MKKLRRNLFAEHRLIGIKSHPNTAPRSEDAEKGINKIESNEQAKNEAQKATEGTESQWERTEAFLRGMGLLGSDKEQNPRNGSYSNEVQLLPAKMEIRVGKGGVSVNPPKGNVNTLPYKIEVNGIAPEQPSPTLQEIQKRIQQGVEKLERENRTEADNIKQEAMDALQTFESETTGEWTSADRELFGKLWNDVNALQKTLQDTDAQTEETNDTQQNTKEETQEAPKPPHDFKKILQALRARNSTIESITEVFGEIHVITNKPDDFIDELRSMQIKPTVVNGNSLFFVPNKQWWNTQITQNIAHAHPDERPILSIRPDGYINERPDAQIQ